MPADLPAPLGLDEAAGALPGIEMVRLLGDAHAPRPAPDFRFGPIDSESLRHFHNDTYLPPVSVYVMRDIELAGPWFMTSSLLFRDGLSFSCPGIDLDPLHPECIARTREHQAALSDGSRILRPVGGQTLLLATKGHQIYGHWLVDFLPKLHLLARAGIPLDQLNILLPTNMGSFGGDYLELLGIRKERILRYDPDREALRIEELIVPTVPRWGGRASPIFADAIADINERIDRHIRVPSVNNGRKLFISRALDRSGSRPFANAEEIEALAVRSGFSLIYPEKLSLLEQIALFRSARRVAGQYGSALHGTIFSRPGIVVAGLHGPLPATFDGLQSGIGERLGQQAGYVFGSSSDRAMVVDTRDFEQCLATWLD